MANYTEDDICDALFAYSCMNMASAAAVLMYARATALKSKRKHRVWICRYLVLRPQYGAYNSLMRDLLELDKVKFRNYIRMDPDVFEELFMKVQPLITATVKTCR